LCIRNSVLILRKIERTILTQNSGSKINQRTSPRICPELPPLFWFFEKSEKPETSPKLGGILKIFKNLKLEVITKLKNHTTLEYTLLLETGKPLMVIRAAFRIHTRGSQKTKNRF
jgi:hypothetical protein